MLIRSLRAAGLVVFVLSLVWTGIVHAVFVVTGDGDVPEVWIAPLRGTPAIGPAVSFLMLQYFVTAFGFVVGVALLARWVQSPAWFGFLSGLLFALWSDTQFLAAGYCGGYTNLPGAIVGTAASGGANIGPWYYVPAVITNLTIYPIAGWLLGWLTPAGSWLLGALQGWVRA